MGRWLKIVLVATVLISGWGWKWGTVMAADEFDGLRSKWMTPVTGGTTYDQNDSAIIDAIQRVLRNNRYLPTCNYFETVVKWM